MQNRKNKTQSLSEEKYSRSLTSEDYDALTEEQRQLLVHKKNIFPVLPYKRWKQAGISPAVAMTVKLFRQMLPDTPSETFTDAYATSSEAEKAWILALGKMNAYLTGRGTERNLPATTLDDLMPDLFRIAKAWMAYRFEEEQSEEEKAIGRALESVYGNNLKNKGLWIVSQFSADVGQQSDSFSDPDKEAQLKQLLQNRAMNVRELMKTWYEIDEQVFFSAHAETQDRERMWEIVSKSRTAGVPTFGKTIDANTIVSGQRRPSSRHVRSEEIREEFGLRALDLPTWTDEHEKQTLLDVVYDSFDQLSEALKLPRKAIGLNGELAVAMNSNALQNKAALYRASDKVLELPRVQDGAQLAQAWFEAFDHLAGHISEVPAVRQALETVSVDTERAALTSAADLLDSIERFVETDGLFSADEIREVKQELTEFVITETSQAKKRMTESADFIESTKTRSQSVETSKRNDDPGLWNACMRREFLILRNSFAIHCFDLARDASEKGILINRSLIGLAQKAVETAYIAAAQEHCLEFKGQAISEFRKKAEFLDAKQGNGPNLATPRQMFVRAGAAYVNSLLTAKGQHNAYLVSIKENQKELYPEGRELTAISAALETEFIKQSEALKAFVSEAIVASNHKNEIRVPQVDVHEKAAGKYRR